MTSPITDDYIEQWLRNEDNASFDERQRRLRWLIDAFGQPAGYMVHHGGFISYRAFEEARRCYLYGQFIAVVLLCQIVLEHTLAGFFRAEGRNDLERDGFQRLLNEALQAGYISQQEY